jgi:lipopolysaccharide transport system permease protein
MNFPSIETSTALEPASVTNAEQSTHLELPVKPLVVIEPSTSRVPLDLSQIWIYRELLYFLTLRDIKVRYKQTVLGASWVVIQPLLTTLIFTIFLGKLARVPSDDIPYALFAYAALLPWTFFAGAIGSSGNSLVGSAHLITKVYFPRMIIPGAAIAARLMDFAIAFVIFVPLMFYYRVALTRNILMLPLFVVLVILLTMGVGLWASALNVRYRDIGVALPVLTQLWMFTSPVVYPASLVPGKWQFLYRLNPMVGIIEGFRSSLFGRRFNWPAVAISTVITLFLLVYSAYTFSRTEKEFADIV